MEGRILEKVKQRIKGVKKEDFIVLFLLGVLLIIVSLPTGNSIKEEKKVQKAEKPMEEKVEKDYLESLEERLENTLSKIEGAGAVKVMITLEGTEKNIIEKDYGEKGNETVFVRDKDGGETPYVSQTIGPKITGVLVVAQGGGNKNVKQNIIEAVQVLFKLNGHSIKVIRMK